ncbi:MAG: phosphotransferase [Candidatus Sabulitectum sp.]|nr:phosphotransferase [Candidatus Sabulitectum sp.]
MTDKEASEYLSSKKIRHKAIRRIPEGANHFVFDVTLDNGEQAIARFGSGRQHKRDSLFGGLLCRHREESNINRIREIGLPAPVILFTSEEFMLVEKLPGLLWNEYLEKNQHTLEACSKSLKSLGKSIAQLQRSANASSFGDADGREVSGRSRKIFAMRMLDVLEYRMRNSSRVFSKGEAVDISHYFQTHLETGRTDEPPPSFVMTDMHPMNFLVGEDGQPTGFFDLETCQYAHPALEMYGIRLFLFNYYSNIHTAEKAFFNSFREEGGCYDPELPRSKELETVLGLMRLLELTISYMDVDDGLRNSWSSRFKILLFKGIAGNNMDWSGAADILREKTQQPLKAL